jgi:hypothetical protein
MSIYATLWWLKFPRYGDEYVGCEWIRVSAQGVPAHVGTPTPGFGYEDGDPYVDFLPPAVEVNAEGDSELMRAIVIVTEETQKSTARSPQEYANPLVILSGPEYASISFLELHTRIVTLYGGQVHGSWCSRLQLTMRCSWYCPTDEFSIRGRAEEETANSIE